MSTLRLAIVGTGRMGATIDDELIGDLAYFRPASLAAASQACEDVELVAGVDTDERRLRAFSERWECPRIYSDYHDMLEQEAPDIVAVTTKAVERAAIVVDAAKAGVRGIYCEKALCCSMEEADEIQSICKRVGTHLVLGTHGRYHAGYSAARAWMEQGLIGEVQSIVYFGRIPLMHEGSHVVDGFLHLLNDPAPVEVQGSLAPRKNGAPTLNYNSEWNRFEGSTRWDGDPGIAWARFGFENGLQAYIISAQGGQMEMEVIGSEGILRSTAYGAEWSMRRPVAGKYATLHAVSLAPVDLKSTTLTCLEDLVRAVKTGEPGIGSVTKAHWNTEMLLGIAESHLNGNVSIRFPITNRSLYIPSV